MDNLLIKKYAESYARVFNAFDEMLRAFNNQFEVDLFDAVWACAWEVPGAELRRKEAFRAVWEFHKRYMGRELSGEDWIRLADDFGEIASTSALHDALAKAAEDEIERLYRDKS